MPDIRNAQLSATAIVSTTHASTRCGLSDSSDYSSKAATILIAEVGWFGYNFDSDGSCSIHNSRGLNNIDLVLGPLRYNDGPTQAMALLQLLLGSRAIDAGNPSGCTDGTGHLLKTDQRGMPRPDTEDAGSCHI